MGTTSSGKEQANDAQNALMHSLRAVNLKQYEASYKDAFAIMCDTNNFYQYKCTGRETQSYLAHKWCWDSNE